MGSQMHQKHQIHQLDENQMILGKVIQKPRNDAQPIDDSRKEHDIYWAGSQWYCNNCNLHGDKPYMTKETYCKGESKDNTK